MQQKCIYKKTFKNILLPFINFSLIISIIHLICGKEDTLNNLLHHPPYALWFLLILFLAHCLWYFSCYIFKGKIQELTSIIIFAILGYCLFSFNIVLPHAISSTFTATFYVGLGYILRKPILDNKYNNKSIGIISILLYLILLILVIIYNPETELSENHLLLIGYIYSFIGITATLLLSQIINGHTMNILSYLGKSSLSIMAVHMQFIFLSTLIIKPFIEFHLLYKIIEFIFVWILTLLTANIILKRSRWILGK